MARPGRGGRRRCPGRSPDAGAGGGAGLADLHRAVDVAAGAGAAGVAAIRVEAAARELAQALLVEHAGLLGGDLALEDAGAGFTDRGVDVLGAEALEALDRADAAAGAGAVVDDAAGVDGGLEVGGLVAEGDLHAGVPVGELAALAAVVAPGLGEALVDLVDAEAAADEGEEEGGEAEVGEPAGGHRRDCTHPERRRGGRRGARSRARTRLSAGTSRAGGQPPQATVPTKRTTAPKVMGVAVMSRRPASRMRAMNSSAGGKAAIERWR